MQAGRSQAELNCREGAVSEVWRDRGLLFDSERHEDSKVLEVEQEWTQSAFRVRLHWRTN
jgi:hypothetical protein